ncbi:MAG: ABC transporter permease [Leptolyngbyaceae cyanobacterium SM1_4_3]|nr:ABC transporter permease [Leptolyngbyaceae cyanobacterium SM1_4_3]NJN04397.1 ABC transporter permease [Leptolyngbyaceae cyanobacterium RM1_1_2]
MNLKLISRTKKEEIDHYYEIIRVLVYKNLKVRYRGSILGAYWSLLNPLTMTGVYTAIFGAVFAEYYNNSTLDYVLAAFTGLIIINFFSASTSQALTSVVSNGAILNKIKLPVSAFPLSAIVANTFQLLLGAIPLLSVITLIKTKSLSNLLLLSIPLISLFFVCLGIGFFVSALYVFFRDLPYFYELITFIVLLSSPVFYPAAIVPAAIKPALSVNPLSLIIENIRTIVLSTSEPSIVLLAKSLLGGLMITALGYICFQYWKSQFMDLL